MKVSDEIAYVLKRQEYGDSSFLVDVFTRHHGRLKLISKGARTGRGEKALALQPFQKLQIGWSGRSDLKTLNQVETLANIRLSKNTMACAFYLNELLWNFVQTQDPHEDLFDRYDYLLSRLSSIGTASVEVMLRRFEFFLLQEIGYGLSLDIDSSSGEPINKNRQYAFDVNRGLIDPTNMLPGSLVAPGKLFLALSDDDYSLPETLAVAKKLVRIVINYRLEGRELQSRKWFRRS